MTQQEAFEPGSTKKLATDTITLPESFEQESLTDFIDQVNRTAFLRTLERGRMPERRRSEASEPLAYRSYYTAMRR
jgi:hypothetical protein